LKSFKIHLSLIAALLLIVSCNRDFGTDNPDHLLRQANGLENKLVLASNTFGFDLFKQVEAASPDTNIFISPLSVSFALGMAYNGAATETAEEMRNTLGYGNLTRDEINETFMSLMSLLSTSDREVIFNIANSAWLRNNFSFKKTFITTLTTWFDADVSKLDFSNPASVGIINTWVKNKTNNKILTIINQIPANAVLYLINAIYFKADWTTAFDPDATTDGFFTLPNKSKKSCRMMHLTANSPYFSNILFEAITLPYENGQYAMSIFLPKPGKTTAEVIADLSVRNWAVLQQKFRSHEIAIQLPKFKMEYKIELKKILISLGIERAFTPLADFSNMSNETDLYISKVKHKTFLKVDEAGTEAAAITAVEINYTSVGQSMYMDRPFIFVIHNLHTDALLFMGVLTDPQN